jgi:DNA-directed RNA polymerase specialized sigma24 family protein
MSATGPGQTSSRTGPQGERADGLSDLDLRDRIQQLSADRHSPEARALFDVLCRYIHRRVVGVSRRCGNALSDSEQEEVVGDVIFSLMSGSLASFRGTTVPELYAFVRTITDRTTWRSVRRKLRERDTVENDADLLEDWSVDLPRPDRFLEVKAESPLADTDRTYLLALLEAGSKAEYARRAGVSRAAVTQRVQRIQQRVGELGSGDRMTHDAWLEQAARAVTRQIEPV